jgi:hypothetical protein
MRRLVSSRSHSPARARYRIGVGRSSSISPVEDDLPRSRWKLLNYETWSRWSQVIANIATIVAVLVAIWAANLGGNLEAQRDLAARAEKDRFEAIAERDRASAEALATRLEAKRLAAAASVEAGRVQDLRREADAISRESALASSDLKARIQDLVRARLELSRTQTEAAGLLKSREDVVKQVARATVAVAISLHLSRARESWLKDRRNPEMVIDAADPAMAPFAGARFAVSLVSPTDTTDAGCRLSERFLLESDDATERSDIWTMPAVQALCNYLREDAHFVELGTWVRATGRGRSAPSMKNWQQLGGNAPFELSLISEFSRRGYEADLTSSFWNLLDPRVEVELESSRNADDAPLVENIVAEAVQAELDRFLSGWQPYLNELPDEFSASDDGPPPLSKITRISLTGLRSGQVGTTNYFRLQVLCIAAWYAEKQALMSQIGRMAYCSAY